MKTLKEYIEIAEDNHVAIGHFNFATIDMLWGIFDAAREVSNEMKHPFPEGKIPVMVGLSGGERTFIGVTEAVALIRHMQEIYDYPIFLNADHNYDVESTKTAIDAGYDMVIIDGAKVTHEENLAMTREIVAYRNEVNPECLVEAELGFIGLGSKMKDELPEGVGPETMTSPEEAAAFVSETGIDLLAPSVGNVHGMIKSGNPALDPKRVSAIRDACGVPLVLHGGSGSADEDFTKVIKADGKGISLIHISTELRIAYRKALEESLASNDAVAPYKYIAPAKESLKEVVKNRITLFTSS